MNTAEEGLKAIK